MATNRSGPADAVVVGAGHNGLVAAAALAMAGWRVVVVERNETVGGAVRSAELTQPGIVHDLYAMNQNLFVGSAAYEQLGDDLARHGLEYCVSDRPFCNVFPDGTSRRVFADLDRTLDGIREHSHVDADGFERLREVHAGVARSLMPLYGEDLPSFGAAKVLARAVRAQGTDRLSELVRTILSSTRELGETFFETEEMRALVACWGMHLDFGPDVAGGALFPLLEVFGAVEDGMAVPKGGASAMPDALVGLIEEHGGEVRTGEPAAGVVTADGRATGVRLHSGEVVHAERPWSPI